MRQARHSLGWVFILVFLAACQSASQPTVAIVTPTVSIAATSEPAASLTTPIVSSPSPTATLAEPTATPEPFLPAGLSPISPTNIGGLNQIAILPVKGIYYAAFSPGGRLLVTIAERWQDLSKFLKVWNLDTGKIILSLDQVDSPAHASFDSSETRLFVFYQFRGFDVYDLEQGKLINTIELPADDAAFSPDSRLLASGQYRPGQDSITISLQDAESYVELDSWTIPGNILHLEFSPDSKLLVSGAQVGNYYRNDVWDVSTGKSMFEIIDGDGLIFAQDASLLATVKGETVNIIRGDNWNLSSTIQIGDASDPVSLIGFLADNAILAVEDRYDIQFIDTSSHDTLFVIPAACDARIAPESNLMITWCYQADLKFWGIKN